MTVEERQLRQRIVSEAQHPLRHSAFNIGYTNPAMPDVTNLGDAFNWFNAVIYPQTKASVATPGDLPLLGNTLRDYRVVLDDGDGKAAGYRWFQYEGEASPSWKKIYDMDWGADEILAGFFEKTQDIYVSRYGYDQLDEDGVVITGDLSGQSIYGGRTANKNLTFYANAGDGVGPGTGFIQVADNFRPLVDAELDIGQPDHLFKDIYGTTLHAGDTSIADGVIDSVGGMIDFVDNILATTNYIQASYFLAEDGSESDPAYSYQGDPDTGSYLIGVGEIGFSSSSTRIAAITASGLNLIDGTETDPALTFSTSNTGWWGQGPDIALSTSGTQALYVASDQVFTFVDDILYLDPNTSNGRVGFGTGSPQADIHFYRDDPLVVRFEARETTAGCSLALARSRSGGANLATADTIASMDAYGMVSGAYSWVGFYDAVYSGTGTTQRGDWTWGTANLGAPTEKMRLRYDGNLGIGVTNPTHTLHVSGDFQIDNLNLDANTILVTNANGNLNLSPDGTGVVQVLKSFLPAFDGTLDLGSTVQRFNALYLDNLIGDGTNSITIGTLLSFRQALTGATTGMTLFYNSGTGLWTASLPDTEIDHGTLTGLADDDHTQYALLAGRSGGQTMSGDTLSGGNLTLKSTAHASQGAVIWHGNLRPDGDLTRDIGAGGTRVNDLYLGGQAIGMRLQNATTAGRPSASAGTKGRVIYDTDLEDVFVDRGGTWKKLSLEKSVTTDTTGWDGVATSVVYTVSSEVSDARECIWVLYANGDSFKEVGCDIAKTQTQVTVSVGIALAAGTYTLIGVG